jgi:methylenetetrahydrofolate reductase (NADPH)
MPSAAAHQLIRSARYELIPLKSLNDQLPFLPQGCDVSITCSPTKGIKATLDLAAQLSAAGHHAVPHIAARLVEGREHVEKIAARLAESDISEIFVVGGDPDPVGPYHDGLSLLTELLPVAASLRRVGVPSYPDHHSHISDEALNAALQKKQALILSHGLEGFTSTQMCFSPRTITHWLEQQRDRGLVLPLHLGVPGAVERARLISLSAKLGIGSSLRYARKNTGAIMRLFAPSGYDPSTLVGPMSRHAHELGIEALHVFTFNSVRATAEWQAKALR